MENKTRRFFQSTWGEADPFLVVHMTKPWMLKIQVLHDNYSGVHGSCDRN